MKKSVLFVLILLSTAVFAVTFGEKIPRIQELPSERAERAAVETRVEHQLQKGSELVDIHNDLEDMHGEIRTITEQVAALRTTVQNVRTEQNVQVSNLASDLAAVRGNTEDIRSLKALREELPPLLDKPQPTPVFLTLLTILNFLVLCGVAGMLWYMRAEHTAGALSQHTHKELHDYIKKNLRGGSHIREIKGYLVQHGWEEDEVDRAIHQIREGETK